jgi:N-methylhydantoinase A
MAAAARTHATDRAIDYRGLPILAFGGAGPVHACMVAELMESRQVIYPPLASVLSAFGTLVTPAQIDLVRSNVVALDRIDWASACAMLDDMVGDGTQALTEAGLSRGDIGFRYSVDVRYLGQQSELRIDLPFDPRTERDAAAIRNLFEAEYVAQYGLKLDGMALEIVNWRVAAVGPTPERGAKAAKVSVEMRPSTTRRVYLRGEPIDVAVHHRAALLAGQSLDGPVIVEERETTIFVLPGWVLDVHENGSLFANRPEEQG